MDVVFLGLPHKVSAGAVPRIAGGSARMIDLSGDFRLKDAAAYETFYGAVHPAPHLSRRPSTGCRRSTGSDREARLIASPGCFATAITLGLLPLAKTGLLEGGVEVVGITGSSGSGAAPSAGTHHPVRAMNLRTYKPLVHQHLPEIQQTLTEQGATGLHLHFVPVSAPLTRGIFATSFARRRRPHDPRAHRRGVREDATRARASSACRKRLPEVVAVSGSNYAEVGFELGPVEGNERLVACFSAIDNLIKGGAGQADAVDEHRARPRRGRDARRRGGLPVIDRRQAGGRGHRERGARVVAGDVARLAAEGRRVVVVHGGGPQATGLSEQLGLPEAGRRAPRHRRRDPRRHEDGRRGQAQRRPVRRARAAGARPVGLHGASARVIEARRRPPGCMRAPARTRRPRPRRRRHRVGKELLELLVEHGYVPVLACLGAGPAARCTTSTPTRWPTASPSSSAPRGLFLVSDVPGVLRDVADPASRIGRLTVAEGARSSTRARSPGG